ncbi:MAG: DNA primase [Candidatus Paceibacterota bacterium]
MSTPVEQIKDRLNIVDFIAGYLKLEKTGINYKGRCPFHNEKTPSFFVSPSRQTYHCFGCHRGGDIFSFLQEIEGLDFPEALNRLAEQAGVTVKKINPREVNEKEKIFKILAVATEYFITALDRHQPARDYLLGRGLSTETIKIWRLGFAPAGWQNLTEHLKAKGFSAAELVQAGLALTSQPNANNPHGRLYDRFRHRLIFPLADGQGRIVGFSGRIFDSPATQPVEEAKYINSPATLVYDKSRILYGFDRAKDALRRSGTAILVEGQMDLLLSHQVGLTNTVATSGTALSQGHLEIISRLAHKLIMAFDADPAGEAAARKAVDLALGQGLEVNIARLPAGADPADLILKDPAKWQQEIQASKHVVDFYLASLMAREKDRRLLGRAIRQEVYPYIKQLAYHIDRAHFIAKIADMLNLPETEIWSDYHEASSPTPSSPPPAEPAPTRDRSSKIIERLFGLIWLWSEQAKKSPAVYLEKFKKMFTAENWEQEKTAHESRREQIIMPLEMEYTDSSAGRLADEIDILLTELAIESLKADLVQTRQALAQAEKAGRDDDLDKLVKKCQTITQNINKLKS